MVNVLRKGKFEFFALTKTKLKGNGEPLWCGVNGIFAGVQEMEIARKSVPVLLNDVLHNAIMDFRCVSSKILWIILRFSRLKVRVAPNKEMVKKGRGSGMTWTGY